MDISESESKDEGAFAALSAAFSYEHKWRTVGAAPHMAMRHEKCYFYVESLDDSATKEKKLLMLLYAGIDVSLDISDVQCLLEFVVLFSHPGILKPEFHWCGELPDSTLAGCIIVTFYPLGSLKDLIYHASPLEMNQHNNHLPCQSLPGMCVSCVQLYGRQILEALSFLHRNYMFCGNLHAGNVIMLDNQNCALSDIISCLFGLPSVYRNVALHVKRVKTMRDLDVYSFGHLLYEMRMGQRLNTPYLPHDYLCAAADDSTPDLLGSIMNLLLSESNAHLPMPSAESLLQCEFFTQRQNKDRSIGDDVKHSFKVRGMLMKVAAIAEQRLKLDKKNMRSHHRDGAEVNMDEDRIDLSITDTCGCRMQWYDTASSSSSFNYMSDDEDGGAHCVCSTPEESETNAYMTDDAAWESWMPSKRQEEDWDTTPSDKQFADSPEDHSPTIPIDKSPPMFDLPTDLFLPLHDHFSYIPVPGCRYTVYEEDLSRYPCRIFYDSLDDCGQSYDGL